MEQRSPEWFQARCGKVTASRIADLMARTRNGYGASRANYMAQLVAERLTQSVEPSFQSSAMAWGTEQEPAAREAYIFLTDYPVDEVGFIDHPSIHMAGASPDGMVLDDGLVEIKCPNTATHINTLLTQKVDGKYHKQMQWQMACTGRAWCDFVSFDPRMPLHLQVFQTRIERDQELIEEIESEVQQFLTELNDMLEKLECIK